MVRIVHCVRNSLGVGHVPVSLSLIYMTCLLSCDNSFSVWGLHLQSSYSLSLCFLSFYFSLFVVRGVRLVVSRGVCLVVSRGVCLVVVTGVRLVVSRGVRLVVVTGSVFGCGHGSAFGCGT
jgi:hypothetical protein